ncbi:hypothetical protein ERO13_1Z049357v2 [Gossypium hirsutum]|jgi:hypothetical protein|nr:hypothetical protein ERO13_1Z049362v2 [Gossypium hirsutum]KAG4109543.1 hypothetical protein ERO13_1Z049357v2 [Gossypium hirsutum]
MSETGTLFLAQCFRTNRGRSCRWCSWLPYIRGTKVPTVGSSPTCLKRGQFFLCRFIPLSDLVFLTENFAVGPKQIQEAECLVHETIHDGTVGQKIEQVPGVTNSGELAPAPAKAPVLPCFSKGDGTARCLTNSLHQVPHLGTPG